MNVTKLAATLAAAMLCAAQAQAQTEIQWWHSMTGANNTGVNELANRFNASQKEYKVVPVFKGSYPESMTAAIAAFRAGNPPHILQVFEVGTATMMSAKGAIVPVAKVMSDAKEKFNPKEYLPTVTGYYSDSKGRMLSYPFNSSTVVFYINRDAFKKAGLDPDKAPKTWKEFNAAAEKLKAAGQECVYTTGWPAWMHIENFSAWHNVPIGTKQNGMAGLDTQFRINSPLHVRHVAMLGDMAKKGLFSYSGRRNEGEARFASGECAMMTSSTGAQGTLRRSAKFDWSVNFIPYHDDVKGAPQNSIIGGASLWVMAKKPAADYKGVAKFFSFLSTPEIQMYWHTFTGYVPITQAAYELTKKSGFYEKNPGAELAVKQLTNKAPTENSKGLRFGNYVQGREVIEEEMEAVFAGKKDAKAAMDDAVRRGNEILRKFEAANK
ncbi:MAG TPA: sn-glycerol-3-phosphate ABC transporter substrate-binding protein UgpB [Burkholderiales bacterium]|nr:sn-glycerol-3-phosphate ABC transporter substrate-binding protein UgpB [Burkholderiales bacterium]